MLNGISHKEWSGIPSHLSECQGNQSNEFFWITFPEEMGNERGSLEIYPARYDQIKQVWHINGNAVNSNNPDEKNNILEVAPTLGLLDKNSHFKKIATGFQSSPLGRCDKSIDADFSHLRQFRVIL